MLTFIATTKSGQAIQLEARVVLNATHSAYEVVAFAGEHRVALGIHQSGVPTACLQPKATLALLGLVTKAPGHLHLDRDHRAEVAQLLAAANTAAEAEAATLLAGLPPTALVQATKHVGSYGGSISVHVPGLPVTGIVAKLVQEYLSKLARAAQLRYALRPGYEATFDAAPLTLAALLSQGEPVLARQQAASAAEVAREAACFAEAARTGQPVRLRAWVEQAGDVYDAVEYAQPDGTRRTGRFNME